MDASKAKKLASEADCTLIDAHIELSEFNKILHFASPSSETPPKDRLFADFALGRKLGAVSVIGTKQNLRQLHERCLHIV